MKEVRKIKRQARRKRNDLIVKIKISSNNLILLS